MYVTVDDYKQLSRDGAIHDEKLQYALTAAERDIDGMTYNRIKGKGFDNLTEFQREVIKQAVIDQADWVHAYGSLLTSPLASYGINGVSMSWDGAKVKQIAGVYTSAAIASALMQTGLMNGRLC